VPTLPTAEWTAALDRMTAALHRTLVDLDRYQSDWSALTDTPASAAPPELLLAWLERRLDQWDERLTTAAELAASVEQQLNERETAIGRWQDLFVRWRELIERGVDPVTTSPGSHPTG
jgi:hypothetical protein